MKKPAAKPAVVGAKNTKLEAVTVKTPVARKAVPTKAAPKAASRTSTKKSPRSSKTGSVLLELKSLAKELNKAAKDLGKASADKPKTVANILGSVERMTVDAANKSLQEAESAKILLARAKDSLSKDWSRKDIEAAMKAADDHLTAIIVAQEFQDLAGQAIRKAMKALVGAIIVVEGGGSTEDNRLSQLEVDRLLSELMP